MANSFSLWGSYVGNSQTIQYLKGLSRNRNLGQVYLFYGPEGVGKHTASIFLAASVICPNQGCGQCLDCKQIFQGINPNVFDISPEGNFLTIGQIREIQHELSLKSVAERVRFVIIDGADRLKMEAANALLKTIEEPPPKTVFLLLTSRPDLVLPTIISRSQRVIFRASSPEEVSKTLQINQKAEKEKAILAAKISGGLYGRALTYLNDEWQEKKRIFLLDILINIKEIDSLEIADRAEQLVKLIQKPAEVLKKKHKKEIAVYIDEMGGGDRSLIKRMELKQKRNQNKLINQGQEEIAQISFSWYRDLLAARNTAESSFFINMDYLSDLKKKAAVLNDSQSIKALETINKAREKFLFNVNVQLGIEALLLRLKQIEEQKPLQKIEEKF